jgi:hypothetical protein
MVHAAGLCDGSGSTLLLPGPGGVGKTALLGSAVADHGYTVLGDDIVLLSGDRLCLSYPRSFVLKDYHRDVYPEYFRSQKKAGRERSLGVVAGVIVRHIVSNMPFSGVLRKLLKSRGKFSALSTRTPQGDRDSELICAPLENVLGSGAVSSSGHLGRICFLERYDGSTLLFQRLTHDSLVHRMFAIILHEWVDSLRQFFSMGALEIVDASWYFSTMMDTIRLGTRGVPSWIVRIPSDCSAPALSRDFFSWLNAGE